MIVISGIVSVYLVQQLLPGALNSLVTRFKTHFLTRLVLLVMACYFGFLLSWLTSWTSVCFQCIIWMDGVCKTTCNLFLFEVVQIFVAVGILLVHGVYGKQPELVQLLLPNLIGIIYLVTSNDWLVTIASWEQFNLSLYLLVSNSNISCICSAVCSAAASMKYFLLSALVTTFMLLAVSIIYALTGTTHYDSSGLCQLVMQNNTTTTAATLIQNDFTYLPIITLSFTDLAFISML